MAKKKISSGPLCRPLFFFNHFTFSCFLSIHPSSEGGGLLTTPPLVTSTPGGGPRGRFRQALLSPPGLNLKDLLDYTEYAEKNAPCHKFPINHIWHLTEGSPKVFAFSRSSPQEESRLLCACLWDTSPCQCLIFQDNRLHKRQTIDQYFSVSLKPGPRMTCLFHIRLLLGVCCSSAEA